MAAVSEGQILSAARRRYGAEQQQQQQQQQQQSETHLMSSVGKTRGRRPSLADWAENLVSYITVFFFPRYNYSDSCQQQ